MAHARRHRRRAPVAPRSCPSRSCPTPSPGPGEVVLDVAAAGLNRADLLQRQGFYPPPPGASDVIGMECSGTVAAVGDDVDGLGGRRPGVRAARRRRRTPTQVAVPAGQLMPVPEGVDLVDGRRAARGRRARCGRTCSWSPALQPEETLLVHGGAGGIGTFAIQLAAPARRPGAHHGRHGGEARLRAARSAPTSTIDYRDAGLRRGGQRAHRRRGRRRHPRQHGRDVPRPQRRRPGHRGPAGGHRHAGRHQGPSSTSTRCCASAARSSRPRCAARPAEEKAAICASVVEHVWPLVADGHGAADRERHLPARRRRRAHALMESGEHTGKILLTV